MKREANLIHKIADIDNLRMAFWKARKSKEGKMEVQRFIKNLDANLLRLREEILSGDVNVGNYHYFTIFDPKERLICAAEFHERVLHHAIMNVCHPIFEKYQIDTSYASRIGKGTYAAIEKAKINQRKYSWFLKLDVRKYFDSIDHQILKQLLERRIKDERLLTIFSKIIDTYSTKPEKGLPIGNLTSQYFANHYLAIADHYLKETLRVPAYIRYMDDMVLWSDDRKLLLDNGKKFRDFLFNDLQLVVKPFCFNRVEKELPFCGYMIYPNKILLTNNSRKRFKTKMRDYNYRLSSGEWQQSEYQSHVIPLTAFTEHACCKGLLKAG